MAKIIMHNILPQGHFGEVKNDAILLLYALIKVNLAHAFVLLAMGRC